MASTSRSTLTPREHQHKLNHLPPSPPPSPPAHTPRRRKKRADSFAQLAAATPLPSPLSSPGLQDEAGAESESLLTRILLTPLLFTSFLLSLFLVNHHNRLRRTTAHPSTRHSLLASLVPTHFLDPEPYQDADDSTWNQRPVGLDGTTVNGGSGSGSGRWFLHHKIRKVARLEVSDAFEIRDLVIAGMGVLVVGVLVAVWVGVRWVWGVVFAAA